MPRPTISLCLIAKDEERNIRRLFESVRGCFDEIILVDTGSKDRTVELAKELGAQVQHFKWVNDFAAARNFSFSFAKTDFIMWLDLDDVLQDRESFINFRDNVMGLADYWCARYDYAQDDAGRPQCNFARERVVRRCKGFEWKYPVHEGLIPIGGVQTINAQYTNAFHVKHMRNKADLEQDRSRNLRLFQEYLKLNPLDGRMLYYYGKELFEAQKPVEGAAELTKALADERLELHDRVLCLQYAAYCYLQCQQFEKVAELALEGAKLSPLRAEYWCLLGDSFIKRNRPLEALPAYAAARECPLPSAETPTAVFTHEQAYGIYPRNQIARIWANTGEIEKAYRESKECVRLHGENQEAKAILEECAKLVALQNGYNSAEPCEDIVFSCPMIGPYRWDPEKAKTQHMGGSETAVMEMAKHLHAQSGRPVLVFNQRDTEDVYDGVRYIPATKLGEYFGKKKPYLHIAWRHTEKWTEAPTFVYCHDLVAPGIQRQDNYDKVLALSPFHSRFLQAMAALPEGKIHVTRNGIRQERFARDPQAFRLVKNPNKVIFSSSPDRGLDRAIAVLKSVRERHPDIELHAFYGIEQLKLYGRFEEYNKLKALIDANPWVKFHGGVSQDELMRHQRESVIWLYPTNFLETSCITALEMIGNGVYPIVRSFGALPDTLAKAKGLGMAQVLDVDCNTDGEIETYAVAVEVALENKAWERVKPDMAEHDWSAVAAEWLRDLPLLVAQPMKKGVHAAS